MLFPTLEFALFFSIVFVLNWGLHKAQTPWKILLCAASYFFYGCWNVKFLALILFITFANYGVSIALTFSQSPRFRKLYLICGIGISLGVLGYFKYCNFFIESFNQLLSLVGFSTHINELTIILPVGISFFTFQAMSYAIDVYRGDQQADISGSGMLDFMVYIAFFPQLVAGPIVRSVDFLPQLKAGINKGIPNLDYAISLILGGLFKKVILSTYLQVHIVDSVFHAPSSYSSIEVLMAIYGFSVQIYCDFSGYSDIAIGTAMLLGFRFPLNFDHPYRALNVQDFWRRWHITLSTWLRDYLYIPLGGNRHGKHRMWIGLMVTMLLGGLWHGASASFVIWGGLHGLALVFYSYWKDRKTAVTDWFKTHRNPSGGLRRLFNPMMAPIGFIGRGLAILITFHFVSALWVFFYHKTLDDAFAVFRALFDLTPLTNGIEVYVIIAIGIGLAIQFIGTAVQDIYVRVQERNPLPVRVAVCSAILIIILKMSPDFVPPFIYFQF